MTNVTTSSEVHVPKVQTTTQATQSTRQLPAMPVVKKNNNPVDPLVVPEPLDTTPIHIFVENSKNNNLKTLYELLTKLDKRLSVQANPTPDEAGIYLEGLYKVLVNVLETEMTDLNFRNHWTLVMRMITEFPNGGFGPHRLRRGNHNWSLGHEKFLHMEALLNLIDASVRHRGEFRTFTNMPKVMVGLSGQAQGQLGKFYSTFG